MSPVVAELEERIRALDADHRAELIRALIAEIDGPPDRDVERAWLQEAQRRHREILDGKVETVPGDQVFENLRARLRR
jgi:putative addiction module component (TIGR02574 family)